MLHFNFNKNTGPQLNSQEKRLVQQGQPLRAAISLRNRTKCGLKEVKAAIEKYQREYDR